MTTTRLHLFGDSSMDDAVQGGLEVFHRLSRRSVTSQSDDEISAMEREDCKSSETAIPSDV